MFHPDYDVEAKTEVINTLNNTCELNPLSI